MPSAKAFRDLFGKEKGPLMDESMPQTLIDQCRQGCGDDADLDMAATMLAMMSGKDAEKVARLGVGPDKSVRTVLVYEGKLAPEVEENGFIDFIVPFRKLIGRD